MKMDRKHKAFLKINIMSLFFIGVSFISVTLAWFAYSGISKVSTEVGVKAWKIDFSGSNVDNNQVIFSFSDIYPGMTTLSDSVTITNSGDSDAELNYSIVSTRILGDSPDNYIIKDGVTSPYVQDRLSHYYPFHINLSLSKNYALSKGGTSTFDVSLSWPLDSDTDSNDSEWGTKAYDFQDSEKQKAAGDNTYQARPSIEIVISVKAEQYVQKTGATDLKFGTGNLILYDVTQNHSCSTISPTCLSTHVIDTHNDITEPADEQTVNLLPDLTTIFGSDTFSNYTSAYNSIVSSWSVPTRPLTASDAIKIVSNDVTNSFLVRPNLSDSIIGYLDYGNSYNTELNKLINSGGNYKFSNSRFSYLSSSSCYWTNTSYNSSKGFAIKNIDSSNSTIYGENINADTKCNIVPVIVALKKNID